MTFRRTLGRTSPAAEPDRAVKVASAEPKPTFPVGLRGRLKVFSPLHYHICLSIITLGDWAYGQRIHDMVEELKGRKVTPATVYLALKRLEDREFIAGNKVKSPDRSERTVRVYRLTDLGLEFFEMSRAYYRKHPQLLDPPKGRKPVPGNPRAPDASRAQKKETQKQKTLT